MAHRVCTYNIRSETGIYHGRISAISERDALAQFNALGNERDSERGYIVQCGRQRPYLVINDFAFYAQKGINNHE